MHDCSAKTPFPWTVLKTENQRKHFFLKCEKFKPFTLADWITLRMRRIQSTMWLESVPKCDDQGRARAEWTYPSKSLSKATVFQGRCLA
jgi:hypothetical protein